jgi:hypothetical protein
VLDPGPQGGQREGACLSGGDLSLAKMSRVGTARTSKRCASWGASSTLTLTSSILPARSWARRSSAGLTMRQGPHHGGGPAGPWALQTAPILIAVVTGFLTMEAVKYLLASRMQARAAAAKPTAGAKPATSAT